MVQHKEPGKLPSHDTGTRKSSYAYDTLDFTHFAAHKSCPNLPWPKEMEKKWVEDGVH